MLKLLLIDVGDLSPVDNPCCCKTLVGDLKQKMFVLFISALYVTVV